MSIPATCAHLGWYILIPSFFPLPFYSHLLYFHTFGTWTFGNCLHQSTGNQLVLVWLRLPSFSLQSPIFREPTQSQAKLGWWVTLPGLMEATSGWSVLVNYPQGQKKKNDLSYKDQGVRKRVSVQFLLPITKLFKFSWILFKFSHPDDQADRVFWRWWFFKCVPNVVGLRMLIIKWLLTSENQSSKPSSFGKAEVLKEITLRFSTVQPNDFLTWKISSADFWDYTRPAQQILRPKSAIFGPSILPSHPMCSLCTYSLPQWLNQRNGRTSEFSSSCILELSKGTKRL